MLWVRCRPRGSLVHPVDSVTGVARLDPSERAGLPDRAFAYIDAHGRRRLPIHDPAHVRNSLVRFDQVAFEDGRARERARMRLLNAAKKFKIVPVGFIVGQLHSERALGQQRDHPTPLPSGFVTMLMTDIEGSTALVHHLGAGYRELIDDVWTILRRAVLQADGHEVEARASDHRGRRAVDDDGSGRLLAPALSDPRLPTTSPVSGAHGYGAGTSIPVRSPSCPPSRASRRGCSARTRGAATSDSSDCDRRSQSACVRSEKCRVVVIVIAGCPSRLLGRTHVPVPALADPSHGAPPLVRRRFPRSPGCPRCGLHPLARVRRKPAQRGVGHHERRLGGDGSRHYHGGPPAPTSLLRCRQVEAGRARACPTGQSGTRCRSTVGARTAPGYRRCPARTPPACQARIALTGGVCG